MAHEAPIHAAIRRLAAYRALPPDVRREREDYAAVLVLLASFETSTPIDDEPA